MSAWKVNFCPILVSTPKFGISNKAVTAFPFMYVCDCENNEIKRKVKKSSFFIKQVSSANLDVILKNIAKLMFIYSKSLIDAILRKNYSIG